ncbi:MAG: metal transporter [Bacteroidota bacterium]
MKKGIVILTSVLISMVCFGQEKNKKMTFEVDGVCEMCKVRIEKAALGVPGVKYAFWDIPSHQLSLVVDERKTNAMQIKSAIVHVGHDTKELKATQEAYESVNPCCRYRERDSDNNQKH